MATQMSPEASPHSSPEKRLSFSPSTPSNLAIVELESVQSSKLEVRDVQVDDRFTSTRRSKRHTVQFPGKSSESVSDWRRKVLDFRSSALEVSETAKGISKYVFCSHPPRVLFSYIPMFCCPHFFRPVEVINGHSSRQLWRFHIFYLMPFTRSNRRKL